MLNVVLGPKGTGKTQRVINMVNRATDEEKGSVVCIEQGNRLTYDISHKARLIDIADYQMDGYAMLRGFIAGLCAGNYDISYIFIDSLYKIVGSDDATEAEAFLQWCDTFGAANQIDFTITISADETTATDGIKKFF